eukprot:TRINITY_DN3147_c0_g1_i2.p1 TRINITY_DN3147_c0_g1~~TRINITY_DN3147_c0_g1_i2.p1  ORF type:complete len:184 (+),score=53.60 TRINITY_DN3147_c0_g1_i2:54-554(+)
MAQDGRVMKAILRGILKGVYEGNEEYTPSFIKEQILSLAGPEELEQWIDEATAILGEAAKGSWELKQFDTFLPQLGWSDPFQYEAKVFWKENRGKIAELLSSGSRWNNSLARFNWRMDVKTRERKVVGEQNVSTAIIEFEIAPPKQVTATVDPNRVVRFEMSKDPG